MVTEVPYRGNLCIHIWRFQELLSMKSRTCCSKKLPTSLYSLKYKCYLKYNYQLLHVIIFLPTFRDWVHIKCIAVAKCNLFFHYCNAKEILFYYFHYVKLCKTQKTYADFVYTVEIIFVR